MSYLRLVIPKEQYLLLIAWTDFLLSREAKLHAPRVLIVPRGVSYSIE
jgi:hypothetical protein